MPLNFISTQLHCFHSYECIVFFSNQFSVHPFVSFSFIWVPLIFPQPFFEAPICAVLAHMGALFFSPINFQCTHLRCSRSYGCHCFFRSRFLKHPFARFRSPGCIEASIPQADNILHISCAVRRLPCVGFTRHSHLTKKHFYYNLTYQRWGQL